MKEIIVGCKKYPSQDDYWLFVSGKLSDKLNDVLEGKTGYGDAIEEISHESNNVPRHPNELSEEMLHEKGDIIGLVNNVACDDGYPIHALVSDRFAEWAENLKERGVIDNVDKFIQRFLVLYLTQFEYKISYVTTVFS